MTMKASLGFRYILHLMDHFSKFHLCAPLKRKTAEEVNSTLTHMFGTIGLPHILQCDNGAEFARLGDIFRGKFNECNFSHLQLTDIFGNQAGLAQ